MGTQPECIDYALEDAVLHADASGFTVVQLGARYGLIIRSAIKLIRDIRPNVKFHAVAVEASVDGYKILIDSMAKVGLTSGDNKFINAGISDENGVVKFVEKGTGSHIESVRYFKAVDNTGYVPSALVTSVRVMTIADILSLEGSVDFLEMDIQGYEYRSIYASIDAINAKVKMICIRTHFVESAGAIDGENGLRHFFKDNGWSEVIYIPNLSPLEIGGVVEPLIDGVQCYINLKIRGVCTHPRLPYIYG